MLKIFIIAVALCCTSLVNVQGWMQIPEGLIQISGNLNYIWGIDHNNHIFMCGRPCTGAWRQIPGALFQVDVDDQFVWGVGPGDTIFFRNVDGTGDWTQVTGGLTHVSASGNCYVWGVNRSHNIYKCKKPCTGNWELVDGGLKQIDGGEREVCGISPNNQLYCRPVDGSGSWRFITAGYKHVSTSGSYEIYGITTEGKINRCRKPCIGQWIKLDHPNDICFSQCDATANALFGVDTGRALWKKVFPL